MTGTFSVFRRLNRIPLKTKLVGSFAVGSLVGVAIGVVGFVQISRVNGITRDLAEKQISRMSNLRVMSDCFQYLNADVANMLSNPSVREREAIQARGVEKCEKLQSVLAEIERHAAAAEEKNALTGLREGIEAYKGYLQQVIGVVSQKKLKALRGALPGAAEATKSQVQEHLNLLYEINAQQAKNVAAQSDAATSSARWLIGFLLIVGISSALLWGVYIANTVARPVRAIVKAIDAADLTSRFGSERGDEIGEMLHSLDTFLGSIRKTIEEVAEIAVAIGQAAAGISTNTDAMAAGADEQSKQATDVSASVEQMSKTILENSRNVSITAESARTAKEAAAHGGTVVQETISGMRRIADVVTQSAQGVKLLGHSSDQIGEIVLVIEDIADQTNLLALNAAIEAARAGEQGRGFAVVADEVRKLAERTTQATKEIAAMISRIQSDTNAVVRSMELGTKEVNQGIELADAAGKSLKEIVDVSQTVTDMIIHIAGASEQQASTSEAIAKSVVEISTVTQASAAGIQQIVSTVGDLNHLTSVLQQSIKKFKHSEARGKALELSVPTGRKRMHLTSDSRSQVGDLGSVEYA